MSSYVFPGYPAFLELAAVDLGRPDSVGGARRIIPLTALANLCAQAAHGDLAHVPGILAKAAGFRDQLAVALRAAELMLADVEAGRCRSTTEEPVEFASLAIPVDPRRNRKGPTNSRESS